MGFLLVATVVIGSIAVAVLVAIDHDRDRESDQRAEVHRVAIALDRISEFAIHRLQAVAVFLELQPQATQRQYARLLDSLVSDHPLVAVSFLKAGGMPAANGSGGVASPGPVVFMDDELGFRVRLRSASIPEANLRPAGRAVQEHLNEVLGNARDSGRAAISRVVRLRGSGDRHLVLFQPLANRSRPIGPNPGATAFVAGVIRVSELIDAVAELVPSDTELALVEADGRALDDRDSALDDYAAAPVVIADRSWELRLVSPESQIWALPVIVGLSGLALAGMIGLLLLNWARRERGVIELAKMRVEERDRALEAEAETNRMYRLLAENLTDMVMVTDPQGLITYVSPAGKHMLGWTQEEMLGKPILSFLYADDEDEARQHLGRLREGAGIHTFEHRLRCADGSYIWVESAVRSIVDSRTNEVIEFQATTRDISERKPLQEQLERLAREDPLTGLNNRRQFNETLTRELARASRSGEPCAVLLIDIDHFKPINDSYGHLTGDRVLRRVGDALSSRMRVSDTVGRPGGDEFAAILPETDAEQGQIVASQLMEAVRDAFEAQDELPEVTVSIGIATFDGAPGITGDHLLERADMALYTAKADGRDRSRLYEPGQNPGRSINV